jgi:hypothetical protein
VGTGSDRGTPGVVTYHPAKCLIPELEGEAERVGSGEFVKQSAPRGQHPRRIAVGRRRPVVVGELGWKLETIAEGRRPRYRRPRLVGQA